MVGIVKAVASLRVRHTPFKISNLGLINYLTQHKAPHN